MSWRGGRGHTHTHKKEVDPIRLRKGNYFVIEEYVEDVKPDEKSVPDLLELIMRAPGLVKEELRRISCKMIRFRSKITEISVSSFWMSGKPNGGQHSLRA